MAHLAMNEMTTYRWSFEEDVENYVAAGITAIGVWREKLTDFGEEKGVELLKDQELAVSSLHWAGGFTGSDGRSHKESIADARSAVELAAQLDAGCLLVYSGSRAGHTHNHARRLFKSALKELLPIARDYGVTLAVEPMHSVCASDFTFLTELDQVTALIDDLDTTSLKLAFDTYHFGAAPETIARLPELAAHLAVVQLGDARQLPCGEPNRCQLGEGMIPLGEIVATLNQSGYAGPFEVKLMGEEIEACDYRELIAQSKLTFDEFAAATPV